eukprot:m.287174 g.287174  ORF g.287174 m.287174 type:complete len:61 (+) comp19442_c3_seq8:496-678(+)
MPVVMLACAEQQCQSRSETAAMFLLFLSLCLPSDSMVERMLLMMERSQTDDGTQPKGLNG